MCISNYNYNKHLPGIYQVFPTKPPPGRRTMAPKIKLKIHISQYTYTAMRSARVSAHVLSHVHRVNGKPSGRRLPYCCQKQIRPDSICVPVCAGNGSIHLVRRRVVGQEP